MRSHLTFILAAISGLLAIAVLVIVAPARAASAGSGNTVFLPIVFANGSPLPTASPTVAPSSTPSPSLTATPTSSPTATPSPTPCSTQVVVNPSFESGTAPWTLSGMATRVSGTASDGSYSVEMPVDSVAGQQPAGVVQTSNVPAWAQTGAFYFDVIMGAHDADGGDQFIAGVVDASNDLIVSRSISSSDSGYSSWTTIRLPISNASAYANQAVTVQFFAAGDQDLEPTAWYIDNVRLVFACGVTTASQETRQTPGLARALRPIDGLLDRRTTPSGPSATPPGARWSYAER